MNGSSLVRVVWAMGLLLPAVVAPGRADACGTAVALSGIRAQPVAVTPPPAPPVQVDVKPAAAPVIIPPFSPAAKPHDKPPPKPRPAPRVIEDNPGLIAAAEQALSEGKLARAAVTTVQVFPALKIVRAGQLPLADRALRILALAVVRSEGKLSVGGLQGATAAQRAEAVAWSIDALRRLNAKRINNPSYQTDLGEALSKDPAHHDEALKVLGQLADKDLLTTAEGYAALARLRAAKGDAAARAAAVKRCETMTKTPQICSVPMA
jgi:hypothetical protein